MLKINLIDDTHGVTHPVELPTGWHEVPLSSFLAFHLRHAGHAPELAPLHAVQVLSNLPSERFDEDVCLAFHLAPFLAWYFEGLPTGEPAPLIEHQGVTYAYAGDFSKLTTGQFEALLQFRDAAEPGPIHAAPQLLAVLYQRPGIEQTAASVAAAAEAFESLPVSVAWPAIRFFLTSWMPVAVRLQAASAAQLTMMTALTDLRAALAEASGASRGRLSRTAASLANRYATFVAGRLKRF
jgi:hypothetical protein